jgi:ParB family chromosome partitioning protein
MLVTKPVSFFGPDPDQPRKTFLEPLLRALGESLKIRQNEPIQARLDGRIIDGERRWRAAKLVGLETLDAIITDSALTDTQINVIRLTSFFHREDLTAWEKWNACQRLVELNPGWQSKDLAAHLKVDPSSITRLMSPSKCTTAWQDALRDGKAGISEVYAASLLPQSEQGDLLALKLSGASRDQIEKAGRKARVAVPPAAKVSRIPILLPGGVSIVIAGADMSLDDAIEALTEALKSARKSRDEGLTAKSFAAAMKDKAKAG